MMDPEKKRSYFARNVEWIALVILVLAGLVAVWRIFYPDLFSIPLTGHFFFTRIISV